MKSFGNSAASIPIPVSDITIFITSPTLLVFNCIVPFSVNLQALLIMFLSAPLNRLILTLILASPSRRLVITLSFCERAKAIYGES